MKRVAATVECKGCGVLFASKTGQSFCALDCYNAWQQRKWSRACERCSTLFQPWRPGKRQRLKGEAQRFCTPECRKATEEQARLLQREAQAAQMVGRCAVCSAVFTKKSRANVVCSDACREKRQKELSRAFSERRAKPKQPRCCKQCGAHFQPTYGDKKRLFCSPGCAKRADPSTHRKRARNAGVDYEPVSAVSVFQRDGWRCQICGCKTPRRLRGTHKGAAPELDHRIPLALGGPHSYENVQTACRACNIRKGATRAVGQLALFPRPQTPARTPQGVAA